MEKKKTMYIMVVVAAVAIVGVFTGCISEPQVIDVDLEVKYGGPIPWINKKMDITDKKEIYIIVKNKESLQIEDLYLKVYLLSYEPTISITPKLSKVVKLGPKGESSKYPNKFIIRTENTPPGEYEFQVDAIYKNIVVKSVRFNIIVGM